MSGTRHKYCAEPAPIQYAPRLDLRLLRALWAQGAVDGYWQAQERLREILRRSGRVYG